MPKVHKSIAQTDRYVLGAKIPDPKTKKGFKIDRSKPRDENDTLFCKKGETYYYYTKYKSATVYTTSYPKPSQLTGSEFLSQVYAISENFEQPLTLDDLQLWKEETVSELESLRDETEDKLSNMPDSLQYGPTGELLQNRIDTLNDWIDEIENLDCEPNDDEDTWKEAYKEENEDASEDDIEAAWDEYCEALIEERISEINLDYQGE